MNEQNPVASRDGVTSSLRIGQISYLNVAPFFHFLPDTGFCGEIVSGVPAELNQMLADGRIDACPSSSFEYGLHADDYLLIPGHSISSIGPVRSVLLFCPAPLETLQNQEFALTGESATSVNLLKILLQEFMGFTQVVCRIPQEPVETLLERGTPSLLIGDRALAAAQKYSGMAQIIDLGDFWYRYTGLPFVFALWIVRRQAVEGDRAALLDFARQLQQARSLSFERLDEVASSRKGQGELDSAEMIKYWRELSYDLSGEHLQGLLRYFSLCCKYGLLPRVPEICFIPQG